jgi:hypothetical protein
MTDKLLEIIKTRHKLTPLSVGEFSTLKANGMTFTVQAYKAAGLGHVSVMRAKGFFGLMKMDTLIINPTELDLPLYSYDRIYAMGNDTLIVELYDTAIAPVAFEELNAVKTAYSFLPERDPGKHWYDNIKLKESLSMKGKKAQTPNFDALTAKYLESYLSTPTNTVTEKTEKQQKTAYYVDGLLTNGGPSTDVFKKSLGVEKTTKLFREILFGTTI